MKTRRILAASTAALLAFGTTAIVSTTASAAAVAKDAVIADGETATTNVTLTKTADVAAGSNEATIKAAVKVNAVTVTATVANGATTYAEGAAADIAAATAAAGMTVTDAGSAKWTVTYKYVDVDRTTNKGVEKTVSIDIPKMYAAGDAADIGKSEGGKLNLGDGVVASASKSGISKTFKDVKISAKNVALKTVGSGDDITIDTENCTVIKGLKKELKEQFEDVKEKDIKILNIALSDGTVVKTKAPGTVTIEVTTSFKPDYVYHVVDDEIEIITGATSSTLVNDGGYKTTFTTTKFSPFILMKGDKLTGAGVSDEDRDPDAVDGTSSKPATSSGASSTTSGAGTTTNPDTGIALAIAPVVLAAGAVAVVALKKKH